MMKQFDSKEKTILISALICVFGLLFLLYDDSFLVGTFSDQNLKRIGEVTPIANDVRRKANKDFQWRPLRRTTPVGWGDGVFTGAKSTAQIALDDGSEITLQENSLIIFTPNRNEMTLDLKFGSVKGQIAENKNLKIQIDGETYNLEGNNAVVEIERRAGEALEVKVVSGELNDSSKERLKKRVLATEKPTATPRPTPTPTPTPEPTPTPPPTPVAIGIEWVTPNNRSQYTLNVDADGNATDTARVQFSWIEPATNEIKGNGYDIQVAKDPAFKTPIVDQSIRKSQAKFEFSGEGKYYARVRVKVDATIPGNERAINDWSSPLEVQVKLKAVLALEAPTLLHPEVTLDGDEQKSTELDWTAVKAAAKYQIEFSPDATFANDFEVQELTELKMAFKPSQGGKTFYRVRGITKDGKPGTPSLVGSVETNISTPILKPIESVTTLGVKPTDPPSQVELKMAWTKVTIAQGYEVEVGQTKDFVDAVKMSTRSVKGSLKVNRPGSYYVRVRAVNGVSEAISPYSNIETFLYEYKIPLSTPILREPMKNVTLFFQNSETTFWLGWSPVKQATRYKVELAADQDFKRSLLSVTSDTNRYLIRQSMPAGKIYWRIKAENDERESRWSETRSISVFTGRKAEAGGQ